jgi:hypothetical protein
MSDAKSLSLFSLDAILLTRFLRSILHSLSMKNVGRNWILRRGRRKHATRRGRTNPEFNRWRDDGVWESHPSRSHDIARESAPLARQLEVEKRGRTTTHVCGRNLFRSPKDGAIPPQTGHFGPIFVLHVLGERAREESGEEVFHLRFHQRRRGLV